MTPNIKTILASITGLGGRIFEDKAPDKTPTPYLVWQGIGSSPENTIDCGAVNENDSYQFVVWGESTAELDEIRKAARLALENNGFYYTGKHPNAVDKTVVDQLVFGRGWDMSYWTS